MNRDQNAERAQRDGLGEASSSDLLEPPDFDARPEDSAPSLERLDFDDSGPSGLARLELEPGVPSLTMDDPGSDEAHRATGETLARFLAEQGESSDVVEPAPPPAMGVPAPYPGSALDSEARSGAAPARRLVAGFAGLAVAGVVVGTLWLTREDAPATATPSAATQEPRDGADAPEPQVQNPGISAEVEPPSAVDEALAGAPEPVEADPTSSDDEPTGPEDDPALRAAYREAKRVHEEQGTDASAASFIVAACRVREGVEARRVFRALTGRRLRSRLIVQCRDLGITIDTSVEGPTADEFLYDARKAYRAGDLQRAYALARSSSRAETTVEALMLMGVIGCELGEGDKVQYVMGLLRPKDAESLASICAKRGLRVSAP